VRVVALRVAVAGRTFGKPTEDADLFVVEVVPSVAREFVLVGCPHEVREVATPCTRYDGRL